MLSPGHQMQPALRLPWSAAVRRLGRVLHWGWAPALWTLAFGLAALIVRDMRLAPAPAMIEVHALLPLAAAATAHAAAIALRRARERAEQQRSELAAVLHDLRGPLVTARSYLELLAAESLGPLPEEARDAAARAAIAAARAQALAAAIGSRHAASGASPVAGGERVELDSVLADVVAALNVEIAAAGVQVEVGALPAVRGDRDALYRVFANLVENAVKYRRRDGTAALVAVSAARDGERWRVSVRDRGIGIPAEERARVFEAGARGRLGLGRPGQGLGLATVRRLVRAQGGEVTLAPEVTDGVCVEVLLPAE